MNQSARKESISRIGNKYSCKTFKCRNQKTMNEDGHYSSEPSTTGSDDDLFHRSDKITPAPPPLPPSDRSSSNSPANKGRNSPKKQPREDDMMQQELKNVLTLFREKRKIEITKTPDVYVTQHSSVEEVQEWLKIKGFSERIRKQLSNINGSELFRLERPQLEIYCGKTEGQRLNSQITICRSTAADGYKTARSLELRAILAKARAKIEPGNFEVKTFKIDDEPLYSKPSKTPTSGGGGNKYNGSSSYANNNNKVTPNKSPSAAMAGVVRVPSFGLTDESDTDSDSGPNNKGTLGKMLKKKRGEILRK